MDMNEARRLRRLEGGKSPVEALDGQSDRADSNFQEVERKNR
jgi:hypothetical protein